MTINPWLSCPKPNPAATVRLFCFPYSGAAASIYYRWAEVLPPSIEVCPVQLPGRGTRLREPLATRLVSQVEAAAAGLAPFFDRPFAFFGHSMGALISFELTRALRRRYGVLPKHLVVSGHGAPQVPDHNPPIFHLPDEEFLAKVRELNGAPDEVWEHPELRQMLLPILRADFTVCDNYLYRPEPPLDCSLSAYGGLGDEHVPRDLLQGWSEQTTAAFQVRMFPGDHFYLNTQQPLLLRTLARELDQVASALT